jgi:phage terminase large subunit-like protein
MTALPPVDDPCLAERWMRALARVHGEGAREILEGILVRLTPEQLAALKYEWALWRRGKQRIPDGAWRVLLILADRSWGKTRAVNEWLQEEIRAERIERFLLIGRTVDDAVRVLVKGHKSGLQAIAPPWFKPHLYTGEEPRIEYPNGAIGYVVGAAEPNSIRGDNLDFALWDEVAAVPPPKAADVFSNVRFALRGKEGARLILTTTSRRKRPILREIRDRSLEDPERWRLIQGHLLENTATPRDYRQDMARAYAGTTVGREEMGGGAIVDDDGEDLFDQDVIDATRVRPPAPPRMRIGVGVDPGTSTNRGSDDTGVVVDGELDGHLYALEDLSGRHRPEAWALATIDAVCRWGAEVIVVERNAGGDMVRSTLVMMVTIVQTSPDPAHIRRRERYGDILRRIPQMIVEVHSKNGKRTRAEPLAAAYKSGRVHHVGELPHLEGQLVSFDESVSSMANKDALDAHVHVAWHLLRLERGVVDYRPGFEGLAKANAAPARDNEPGAWRDDDLMFPHRFL